MILKLLTASMLLASCVAVHALSLTGLLHRLPVNRSQRALSFAAETWLLIRVAWWLITSHLIQIAIWAVFYYLQQCMPDLESASYFSIVTYTTVGYGDLLLGQEWRMLAGVEALTGILMCGLSTGFFFAIVSRLYDRSVKVGRILPQ
jgi:hypothetical protein